MKGNEGWRAGHLDFHTYIYIHTHYREGWRRIQKTTKKEKDRERREKTEGRRKSGSSEVGNRRWWVAYLIRVYLWLLCVWFFVCFGECTCVFPVFPFQLVMLCVCVLCVPCVCRCSDGDGGAVFVLVWMCVLCRLCVLVLCMYLVAGGVGFVEGVYGLSVAGGGELERERTRRRWC